MGLVVVIIREDRRVTRRTVIRIPDTTVINKIKYMLMMTITGWVIDYHATSEEGVHRETVRPGGDRAYLYSDKLNGLSEGSEPCD